MSLIAESLKRLKAQENGSFASYTGKIKNINTFDNLKFLYLAITAIFVLILLMYGYSAHKKINNLHKKMSKFIPISQLNNKIAKAKNQSRINKNTNIDFEYYLSLNKLDKLFNLAQKNNSLKYEAIYYAKTSKEDKAIELLKTYIKSHKNDIEAQSYLAFAFYKKGLYGDSLNILKNLKSNNYKIILDIAVLYEDMGMLKKALNYYEMALKKTDGKALKSKIRKKIIVLKYYFRNKNES